MSDRLIEALRASPAAPPAPIETLVRRGRKAKRARTATYTGLGAGALALAVAAGLTVPGNDGQTQRAAPMTSAGTSTFRLKVTFELMQKGKRDEPEVWEGAFDAKARKGYLRAHGMEYRFIGDKVYLQRTGWRLDKNGLTFLTRGTIDPVELAYNADHPLRPFQKRGKIGPTTGGTYGFAIAADKSTGSPAGKTVDGTLILGPGGRAQKVVQNTVITSPEPEIADRVPVHFTSTVEFSGYGTAVSVERPAA